MAAIISQPPSLREDGDEKLSKKRREEEPEVELCVIIPARNAAQYLPETLSSLAKQTFEGATYCFLSSDSLTSGDTYYTVSISYAEM